MSNLECQVEGISICSFGFQRASSLRSVLKMKTGLLKFYLELEGQNSQKNWARWQKRGWNLWKVRTKLRKLEYALYNGSDFFKFCRNCFSKNEGGAQFTLNHGFWQILKENFPTMLFLFLDKIRPKLFFKSWWFCLILLINSHKFLFKNFYSVIFFFFFLTNIGLKLSKYLSIKKKKKLIQKWV